MNRIWKTDPMATRHKLETELMARSTQTTPPPLWQVILLNDDFTPMDFVVMVLQTFFGVDAERATRIMLKVHTEGRGICGVYPKDVAATKVSEVTSCARQHQHPLQCIMEIEQ